jgi:hypothetical protein
VYIKLVVLLRNYVTMMHGQQNIKNGWATIVVVGRLRVKTEKLPASLLTFNLPLPLHFSISYHDLYSYHNQNFRVSLGNQNPLPPTAYSRGLLIFKTLISMSLKHIVRHYKDFGRRSAWLLEFLVSDSKFLQETFQYTRILIWRACCVNMTRHACKNT